MIEHEFVTNDTCSQESIATLAACGALGRMERVRFTMHRLRCGHCRSRFNEATSVNSLVSASFAPPSLLPHVARPINRILVIALGASIVGLALSAGIRSGWSFGNEAARADSKHDCEPISTGPPVRPEIECEEPAVPVKPPKRNRPFMID